MQTKSSIGLALTVALFLSLLAACGSPPAAAPTDAPTAAEAASPPAAAATSSPMAEAAGGDPQAARSDRNSATVRA
ncbi:MAG: phosphate-binding protein, partial [Chloroflexales bacterium]|nr:phosphate-binding protein [Chloroflexales bacterium]